MDRKIGRVKKYVGGHGFILNEDGVDVFLHKSNIVGNDVGELIGGELMTFVEYEKEDGRLVAMDAKIDKRRCIFVIPDDAKATVLKLKNEFSDEVIDRLVVGLTASA